MQISTHQIFRGGYLAYNISDLLKFYEVTTTNDLVRRYLYSY